METTMSGQAHLALMAEARAAGMSPCMLYFIVDEDCLAMANMPRGTPPRC